ncbi:MAG: GNAT family N-acetyltransferase [Myxococcales bacterium]|nr:GNAT family N-acetyltransferase [Myxococcales bacterium]
MRWRWASLPELTTSELHEALRLRSEVFVVEQDCVYLDLDGRDPEAMHLLGIRDGQLGAYLRAFGPDAHGHLHIGRVVVGRSFRGTGLGTTLMREGMGRARARWGPHPVQIAAQAHLRGFYGELGFEVVGPGYDEDGIPHVPMRAAP